ncbi:MAG TPA: hypothetical protein VK348_07605 [Planctomycetota bacterium]|nr:hypothetical protein [Planctomycetota bacterium]
MSAKRRQRPRRGRRGYHVTIDTTSTKATGKKAHAIAIATLKTAMAHLDQKQTRRVARAVTAEAAADPCASDPECQLLKINEDGSRTYLCLTLDGPVYRTYV